MMLLHLRHDDGNYGDPHAVPFGEANAGVAGATTAPAPHGAPSATPTMTTGPSPTTTTVTGAPGGGGDLPTTGPDVTGLIVFALAVLVLGAALVAAAARMYRARHSS